MVVGGRGRDFTSGPLTKLRVGGRQGALKLQSRGPGDVCGRHWKNVLGSRECLRVAEGDRAVGAGPLEVLFGGGAEGEGEGAWSYVCESTLRTWGL